MRRVECMRESKKSRCSSTLGLPVAWCEGQDIKKLNIQRSPMEAFGSCGGWVRRPRWLKVGRQWRTPTRSWARISVLHPHRFPLKYLLYPQEMRPKYLAFAGHQSGSEGGRLCAQVSLILRLGSFYHSTLPYDRRSAL